MRINIPAILAGQGGYADAIVHDLAPAVKQLSQAAAMATSSVQDQYAYNNLAFYEDGPDGLKIQEATYHDEYWQKQDGSDPNAMENYELGLRDLQRNYVDKSRSEAGDMVADLMDKRAQLRAQKYYESSARINAKQFFNNSVEANNLRANQAAKDLSPYFDNQAVIQAALSASDAETESQRGVFGLHTDTVKRNKRAVIVEQGMRIAIADPNSSTRVIRAVNSNPAYQQYLFSQIPADKVDDVMKLMKSTGQDNIRHEAYISLYQKHNGNFSAMNADLSKPEIQQALGLGLEDSFYVKRQISDAQADQDKADQQTWNENATNVFLNLSRITPGQIDQMVREKKLSYQLGEHFKQEKKQALTGPSDPYAWYRAYTMIKDSAGDSDSMVKARNQIFAMGGISFADKKDLIRLTETTDDKYEAGLSKKGMDYIKAVVMPSQTMISAAKPEEAKKFLEAGMAFELAMENAKKNKVKITPEFIEKTSKEISSAYSMTIYEQMDAVTAAQRAAKAKKSGQKKDQYGYYIGETMTVNGKTYKYIGNDQWQ